MPYNFFDTVGGHEFTNGTVPALVREIEDLNSSIKKLNNNIEKLILIESGKDDDDKK